MKEWLDSYLKSLRRRRLSEKTIKLYEDVLSNLDLDLSKCSEKQLYDILDKLASEPKKDSKKKRSDSYYRLNVILIKAALKFLDRKDLADKIELPKIRDREGNIKEQILTDEDIKKLIEKAPTEQDRLLIYMLYESGARPNELYNLRIKDVQFDEHSAILWLTGKTGTRQRRVYMTVNELKDHIAKHPERNNTSARFFRFGHGGSSDFHERTISNRIRRLGKEILGKQINPRMFRHTKATKDCQDYKPSELMKLFGWKTPTMINVYTHLTDSDVDQKDLLLHGIKIKKKDVLKPLMQIQVCSNCQTENAPYAVYCHKCSHVLTSRDMDETLKEMRKFEETTSVKIRELEEKIVFAGLDQKVMFVKGVYTSEKALLPPKDFEKKYGFKPDNNFDSTSAKNRLGFIDVLLKRTNLDKETRTLLEEAREFWEYSDYGIEEKDLL